MSGSYAYVAAISSDSLVVVDISNAASPAIRGSVVSSSLLDGVRMQLRARGWRRAPRIKLASAALPPLLMLPGALTHSLLSCAHRLMASP